LTRAASPEILNLALPVPELDRSRACEFGGGGKCAVGPCGGVERRLIVLDDDGSMERGEGMNPMVCDDRIKRVALSGGGVYGGGGDGIDAIFRSQNLHKRRYTGHDGNRDLCTAKNATHLPFRLLLW